MDFADDFMKTMGLREKYSDADKEKGALKDSRENNPFLKENGWEKKKGGEGLLYSKHRLIMQDYGSTVEKLYYAILNEMIGVTSDFGQGLKVEKVKDELFSSESGSMFGVIEQRKAIQQEKVMNYVAQIGQMVKQMWPLIREIRLTKEKMEYHEKSLYGDESAERALKDTYILAVEGGAENPGSVYGLARKVGFLPLPDLFFAINPKHIINKSGEISYPHESKILDETIEKMKDKIPTVMLRETLKRKLYNYYTWKKNVYKELQYNKKFKVSFLKQHYEVIRTYISWIKPYLKNIEGMKDAKDVTDPMVIKGFENVKMTVELIGTVADFKGKYKPYVMVRFTFVSFPNMMQYKENEKSFAKTGYVRMEFMPYVATEEQYKEYKRDIENQEFQLVKQFGLSLDTLKEELDQIFGEEEGLALTTIMKELVRITSKDENIKKAYEENKDLFTRWIEEGKTVEQIKQELKKVKGNKEGLLAPILELIDIIDDFLPDFKKEEKEGDFKKASSLACDKNWRTYRLFKKAQGLAAD